MSERGNEIPFRGGLETVFGYREKGIETLARGAGTCVSGVGGFCHRARH